MDRYWKLVRNRGKANEHRHQENQVLHHLLRHHPRVGEGLEHRVHDVGGDHRVAQGQNGEHRRGTQGEHVPLPVALQLFPHPFELKHRTPPPLPYFFALAQKSVLDKAFPIIATAPKKGRGFCGKVPRQSAEFSPFSPALLCQVALSQSPHSKRRARPAPGRAPFPGPPARASPYRLTSSAAARSQASSSPSSSRGVPTTTWWVHRPGRGSTRPEILGWSRGSRRPKGPARKGGPGRRPGRVPFPARLRGLPLPPHFFRRRPQPSKQLPVQLLGVPTTTW